MNIYNVKNSDTGDSLWCIEKDLQETKSSMIKLIESEFKRCTTLKSNTKRFKRELADYISGCLEIEPFETEEELVEYLNYQ